MKQTGGPFCAVPLDEQHLMHTTRSEAYLIVRAIDQLLELMTELRAASCDAGHTFTVDTHGLRRASTMVLKRANILATLAGQVESAGIDADYTP